MSHCQSIHRKTAERVQRAGLNLFSELIGLIKCCHDARDSGDSTLGRYLLWTWCLNFDEFSHQWMMRIDALTVLRDLFSLDTLDRIRTEQMHREDASDHDIYAENLWTPIFVRDGLKAGSLSKWQVIHHMARVRRTEGKHNKSAFVQSVALSQEYAFLEESQPKDLANERNLEDMMVMYENFVEAVAQLKSGAEPGGSVESAEMIAKVAEAEQKEAQEKKIKHMVLARSKRFQNIANDLTDNIRDFRLRSGEQSGEQSGVRSPKRRPSSVTDGGGCESLRTSAASLYRFLSIQLWMNRDVDDLTWNRVSFLYCCTVVKVVADFIFMY